ncbi:MAG: nucleotide exchange factor GrpE [Chloroflexia bacterium]|nr:nucleotide exchange factor GrpE [Chloroflexia bacterium]
MPKEKERRDAPAENEPEATSPAPEAESPEEQKAPLDEMDILRQELEQANVQAAEYHDQWLRTVAELRNYKKRIQQERETMVRQANAELIGHLLPVLDDLDRAIESLPQNQQDQTPWIEGIQLIHHRLRTTLQQHGLQVIQAIGETFDPYYHDGILFEEVDLERDQEVLQELQKGYKLHDRVLRPTMVKVGRAMTSPGKAPDKEPLETTAE